MIWINAQAKLSISVRVKLPILSAQPDIYIYIYVCRSACLSLSLFFSLYIYVYICVCLCMCLYVRTYECKRCRRRKSKIEKGSEDHRGAAILCFGIERNARPTGQWKQKKLLTIELTGVATSIDWRTWYAVYLSADRKTAAVQTDTQTTLHSFGKSYGALRSSSNDSRKDHARVKYVYWDDHQLYRKRPKLLCCNSGDDNERQRICDSTSLVFQQIQLSPYIGKKKNIARSFFLNKIRMRRASVVG